MTIDKAVMVFAGVLVLLSLGLAVAFDPAWLWLTAFVGANMIQAPLTGFCPAAYLFKRAGVEPGCAFFGHKHEKQGCCCSNH